MVEVAAVVVDEITTKIAMEVATAMRIEKVETTRNPEKFMFHQID